LNDFVRESAREKCVNEDRNVTLPILQGRDLNTRVTGQDLFQGPAKEAFASKVTERLLEKEERPALDEIFTCTAGPGDFA
jgi:hypothetical protein